MTELNRRFLGVLAECRQKNLFLFIVCPNFFDLDKNVALWRSRGLFYIYHEQMTRGFFKFYSYEKKKRLWIDGKRYYNYNVVKPNFFGRFTKYMVVDEKEYRIRKLKAFEVRQRERDRGEDKFKLRTQKYFIQRTILAMFCYEKGRTWREIAEFMTYHGQPINEGTIRQEVESLREDLKKRGLV